MGFLRIGFGICTTLVFSALVASTVLLRSNYQDQEKEYLRVSLSSKADVVQTIIQREVDSVFSRLQRVTEIMPLAESHLEFAILENQLFAAQEISGFVVQGIIATRVVQPNETREQVASTIAQMNDCNATVFPIYKDLTPGNLQQLPIYYNDTVALLVGAKTRDNIRSITESCIGTRDMLQTPLLSIPMNLSTPIFRFGQPLNSFNRVDGTNPIILALGVYVPPYAIVLTLLQTGFVRHLFITNDDVSVIITEPIKNSTLVNHQSGGTCGDVALRRIDIGNVMCSVAIQSGCKVSNSQVKVVTVAASAIIFLITIILALGVWIASYEKSHILLETMVEAQMAASTAVNIFAHEMRNVFQLARLDSVEPLTETRYKHIRQRLHDVQSRLEGSLHLQRSLRQRQSNYTQRTDVDLFHVVRPIVERHAELRVVPSYHIRLDVIGHSPVALAIPAQVALIVDNMLRNATQHYNNDSLNVMVRSFRVRNKTWCGITVANKGSLPENFPVRDETIVPIQKFFQLTYGVEMNYAPPLMFESLMMTEADLRPRSFTTYPGNANAAPSDTSNGLGYWNTCALAQVNGGYAGLQGLSEKVVAWAALETSP